MTAITEECCELYWACPRGNTQQNSCCTATYHPSRKLSKLDDPDILDTALRNKDELINDTSLKNPSHGRAKVGRPARTYIQQLYANTWTRQEDLSGVMDDRDGSGRTVIVVWHDDEITHSPNTLPQGRSIWSWTGTLTESDINHILSLQLPTIPRFIKDTTHFLKIFLEIKLSIAAQLWSHTS